MPITTLIHKVPLLVEETFPFFSDLNKFVAVHPVIFQCNALSENEFLFFEKLDLKLFKITFSYKVKLEKSIPNQQVIMFSEIRKGAILRLTFDFKKSGDNTVITETVDFKGPLGVNALFLRFLTKTHVKLVSNLPAACLR